MWEVRVKHDGLKAYRVVRGVTKEEAELKANLQIAAWNERWAARLKKLAKSSGVEVSKRTAQYRTAVLELQFKELELILAVALERPPFQWNSLKDSSEFALPCPKEPVVPQIPAKPAYPEPPDPLTYAARLTVVDHLFGSRRAKKENVAAAELEAARAAWRNECASIDDSHEKLLAVNEACHKENLKRFRAALSAWDAARTQHQISQEQQHAQIDALREEYAVGNVPAVEYFFSEVLNHSSYPESFPRGSTLSFSDGGGVLIVDYELPNQSVLPAIKEVKYNAAREEFQEVLVSAAWLKKTFDEVLYQIALRTLHELYTADESKVLESVVFNGWVQSIDKATGVDLGGHPKAATCYHLKSGHSE